MTKQDITVCFDAYPDPDTDVFCIGAVDDIRCLLADAHNTEFSISELVDATSVTCSTFWRTVDPLDSIDAIQIRETPQRNYIAINPDHLQKCDPILAIPQSEFYAPIQAFVDRVEATIPDARQSILWFRIDSALLSTKELDDNVDILIGSRLLFKNPFERVRKVLRRESL